MFLTLDGGCFGDSRALGEVFCVINGTLSLLKTGDPQALHPFIPYGRNQSLL